MESYVIENLHFHYPGQEKAALQNISLSIPRGQFVVICGFSGCGKSTLLRQLKSDLAPHGKLAGQILFEGQPLADIDRRQQSSRIGFVMQNPDSQIVAARVWHELAFGLESLGSSNQDIRLRVAETASFFGIHHWFDRDVNSLSGGQKQLLSLAAIMTMQPAVLVLDEPTSQLDPIAAENFLAAVHKINQELGVTVILAEQRLENVLPMADRVIVMDSGTLFYDGLPRDTGMSLKIAHHGMYMAMPSPVTVYAEVEGGDDCPVTVREGRTWLEGRAAETELRPSGLNPSLTLCKRDGAAAVIEMQQAWFRYERGSEDVIRDLSLVVCEGEFLAITGGNGAGKSTALSLISGLNEPQRGRVLLDGQVAGKIPIQQRFNGLLGCLPQDPKLLFMEKSVKDDLHSAMLSRGMKAEDINRRIDELTHLCRLEDILEMHPYDLSGGEQQRAGLAMALLSMPRILLLDEPTKGMDAEFKQSFARIIKDVRSEGTAIVMVSHDIEFCARHADSCALFFNGNIAAMSTPREFFSGNSCYTTAASRMARHLLPLAITAEDIIEACGVKAEHTSKIRLGHNAKKPPGRPAARQQAEALSVPAQSSARAALHAASPVSPAAPLLAPALMPALASASAAAVAPARPLATPWRLPLPSGHLAAVIMILLAVPLTVLFGMYFLDDRRYYFISLLVAMEMVLPFLLAFEIRGPRARELVLIAVLCAMTVAGRAAFYMLPQVKPMVALVVVAGAGLGGEAGFLVGALSALVSDCFFGQGPWTPWQMFCLGIIGFLAGVLFKKGLLPRSPLALAIFGALAALIIYGGLMNPAAVLIFQPQPTMEMFALAYIQGLPFDMVHAAASAVFLMLISRPMLDKLERITTKYGLLEP